MSLDVRKILDDLGIDIISTSNNNFVCRCPFGINHRHNDRHPSFGVRIEDGLYNCFAGCSSGSLLDLVLRLKQCDLDEALYFIYQGNISKRFFSILGRNGKEYIGNVKSDTIDLSKYNFNATYKYLLDRGFSVLEIKRWGLGIDKYDKSIVIPVFFRKVLHGVIKRYLYNNQRYWNSPGLQKSKVLFGYDLFEPLDGWVNLCEGPLDCIWLHQNGFRNSVSSLGIELSEEQYNAIKELGNGIRVCYDNDAPGKAAGRKLLEKHKYDSAIELLNLPGNVKDIQEISELGELLHERFRRRIGDNLSAVETQNSRIISKTLYPRIRT